MKICLVSSLYNPDIVGGAENAVAALANGLADEGHRVVVVATKPSPFVPIYQGLYRADERAANFFIHMDDYSAMMKNTLRNLAMTPIWHALDIWNARSYAHVRDTLEDFSPDIINSHNIFGMTNAVWSAARSLKIPLVHTLYDYALICPRTTRFKEDGGICKSSCSGCSLYAVPKFRSSKGASAVIAPSQPILDHFLEGGFFRRAKQFVIPCGVSTDQRQGPVEPGLVRFLCIGPVSRHKGILTLIRAFKRVDSFGATLNIVGMGDCLRLAQKIAGPSMRQGNSANSKSGIASQSV